MTLSRSTSTNCCGTLGRKVVLTFAISGRLRAAARNLFRLSARNWTSLPARSSRTKVNPPEVPTPGMAGGGEEEGEAFGSVLGCGGVVLLNLWKLLSRDFGASPGLLG